MYTLVSVHIGKYDIVLLTTPPHVISMLVHYYSVRHRPYDSPQFTYNYNDNQIKNADVSVKTFRTLLLHFRDRFSADHYRAMCMMYHIV